MGIFDVLKFGTRPGKLSIDKEAFEATRAAYNHSTALDRAMDVKGITSAAGVKSKLIGSTAVGATTLGSVAAASSLAFDPSNTFDNTITAAGAGGAVGLLASTAINARRGRLGKITTTAQDYAHSVNTGQAAPKLSMKDALFSDSYQLQNISKAAFSDHGSDAYNNAQSIFTKSMQTKAESANRRRVAAGARARRDVQEYATGVVNAVGAKASSLKQSTFTTAANGFNASSAAVKNVANTVSASATNAAKAAATYVKAAPANIKNQAVVNTVRASLAAGPSNRGGVPTPVAVSRTRTASSSKSKYTPKPYGWNNQGEGYIQDGKYATVNSKVSRNFEGLDAFSASERVASIHMPGNTYKGKYYNAERGHGQIHATKISSARGRYSGYKGNVGAPKVSSYNNVTKAPR